MAEVEHACRRHGRPLRCRHGSVPPHEGGVHGTAAHEGEGALDEEHAVDYAEKSWRWWRWQVVLLQWLVVAVDARCGWVLQEASGDKKQWKQQGVVDVARWCLHYYSGNIGAVEIAAPWRLFGRQLAKIHG